MRKINFVRVPDGKYRGMKLDEVYKIAPGPAENIYRRFKARENNSIFEEDYMAQFEWLEANDPDLKKR